jgi:glycosyltransferase involved in cell wall biosynthesis
MTETKYSAVIIAKNDQSTIGECIFAMQKLTNDILIVLDDRSDDNTENICLQHGVRLIKKTWEGYSKNKILVLIMQKMIGYFVQMLMKFLMTF